VRVGGGAWITQLLRVLSRTVFSVVSIVFVGAGVLWTVEVVVRSNCCSDWRRLRSDGAVWSGKGVIDWTEWGRLA
jgi:hypothetical protein